MLKALEQFLETIVSGFAVLVSVGVAWSVLLCLVRAGVCRLAYLARQGAVLSILFGSMAIVGIVTGFAKTNGTDRVGALRRIELCPTDSHLVGGIGSDDIAWGWRVVSVCSNALEASIFAMPTNAVVWDGALRHGAGHGSWRLPAGWRFPFNGPVWTNGFLWVEGVFRSRFDNRSDEIRILDERLTLCPAANWARYSLDASRAWCLVNDNGSLVATFENAALGDDPARIVSAQLELRSAQGEIALRYDLHTIGDDIRAVGPVLGGTFLSFAVTSNTSEVVFRRVHLDDWDWDGLPNEIDDQPYVPCAEPAWGQSDEWAACAFPDNVAEITAAGGYHAWVTARAAEPDRHLVGLEISSPDNVWPIRVSFGDLQVMCDSTNRLYFAIDDGAKYTFELSDGVLSSVTIGNEDRVGSLWEDWYHPWDWCFWPTMVTAHMDSAKAGWIGRLPSVTVDGLEGTHFYPNDSKQVSVVVTDCHADSVRDYRWSGGADFTFSNPTSRTTMVTWGGGHAWATNVVRVVTTYEGGLAVTNDHTVTVGMQPEPDTTFSVSCQKVFFLNDAEILADGSWTNNRPERIRPIRVDMRAARGTQGTLAITATGAAQPMLFRVDENGVTNIVPSGARIPLGIESGSLTRETTETFYASCPHTGTAMFEIVCQLEDGPSFATNVTCRVIEPLRRLINVERFDGTGPVVNPSRLVLGTNAILRVGVNGYFPESNVVWKVVSGKANVESHGFWAVVEPTDDAVDPVKVEARFNEDEIQPTFELPVVGVRKIPVRAFRVNPPMDQMRRAWSGEMISNEIARANAIFAQAGILFELEGEILTVGSTNDWIATSRVVRLDDGRAVRLVTEQTKTLLNNNVSSGCVEIYFLGGFSPGGISGFYTQYGIAIGVERTATTLAHELGHALGLADCYAEFLETDEDAEGQNGDEAVTRELFVSGSRDWGEESGRGFYDKIEDTWLLTIQRLLMWSEASETKVDIPDDMVKGALLESDGGIHGVLTAVGVEDIKPANTEVFSK